MSPLLMHMCKDEREFVPNPVSYMPHFTHSQNSPLSFILYTIRLPNALANNQKDRNRLLNILHVLSKSPS